MRYIILLLLLTGCYYIDGQLFFTNETYQGYQYCLNQSLQLSYLDLMDQYNVCMDESRAERIACDTNQYYACKKYIKASNDCFDEGKWRDMYISACTSSYNDQEAGNRNHIE